MLMFHSCAVAIATVIQNREEVDSDASHVFLIFMFMGIHCLWEDFLELSINVNAISLT